MQMVQTSEQELIECASYGDLEAFNQLVLDHQSLIYRYACSLMDDPAAAEDVTQESFIKAYQNIKSFRGGSFRAWLMRIATNTLHDHMRWTRRHPTTPLIPEDENGEELESPAWMADEFASVEAITQHREETDHLYRILDELPAAYRNILTLIDVYEMDYVEAAEVLCIPLGTVKSRLARARMQMRGRLQISSGLSFSWAI